MRDVSLNFNVFDFLPANKRIMFTGTEQHSFGITYASWMGTQYIKCGKADEMLARKEFPHYRNCGVVGGDIESMREYLNEFCDYLSTTNNSTYCDMVAANHVLQEFSLRKDVELINGYPMVSVFGMKDAVKEVLISHK